MILSRPSLRTFMRNILFLCLLWLGSIDSFSQELNCTVGINSTQIQTTDRNVFKDMKTALEQFMNSRKWTNDTYKNYEKISCNIMITITKMPAIGSFNASVQIRSARPVLDAYFRR